MSSGPSPRPARSRGDVDRACVLESSPPAAGARPETWRAARIESLVVDGVAIPLEQEEAEA